MIRKVLIPLDGSAFSEQALPLGVDLARRAGAAVVLVRVHQPFFAVVPYAGTIPIDARWEEQLREQEREELARTAEALEVRADVATEFHLLDGPIAEAIERFAQEHGVDLVVMTTHGRSGLSRAWLGSVADALVRRTTAPVLLVRPSESEAERVRPAPFRRILVPLDGSRRAEAVLPHAQALARLMDGELVLLRVVLPRAELGHAALDPALPLESLEQEARDEAMAYLREIARRIGEEGTPAVVRVVHSRQVALAILDQVGALDADAIAMATRGRGGFTRLVLGSTADKVLRATSVPLLLIRPGE